MLLTSSKALWVILLISIAEGIILAYGFLCSLTYGSINMTVVNWARVWLFLLVIGKVTLLSESERNLTVRVTASKEPITLISLITHRNLLFHIGQVRWLAKLLRCSEVILNRRNLIIISWRTILSRWWWTVAEEVYLIGWVPGHTGSPTDWKLRLVCTSWVSLFTSDQFRQAVVTWSRCV